MDALRWHAVSLQRNFKTEQTANLFRLFRLPPTPGVQAGVVHAYYNEINFARLERARELATQYGCTANAIALGYLISQPFPTCAIVGCGTSEHLRDSCAAGDIVLSPDEIAWLEGA